MHLTHVIREVLRPTDVVARFGGEEFVLLFPDTPAVDAAAMMTRLQRELTKRFESIERMPLRDARAWLEADPDRRRGEFVLVVEGRPVERGSALDARAVLEALLAELPLKQAVALAATLTGGPRNDLDAPAPQLKR